MCPGTLCQQLEMYLVFESTLQMLADNPSTYCREPECMKFLSLTPTVWNYTKAVAGKVGD